MSTSQVQLNQTILVPGETLSGIASWSMDSAPKAADLRLFWFVDSPGGTESKVIATQSIPHPAAVGQHAFSFTVPQTPPSYHGVAFRLEWAVELVLQPSQSVARAVFVSALVLGQATRFTSEGNAPTSPSTT